MAQWQIIDGTIGPSQAIDATSTTQDARLGQRIKAKDMASTDYGIGEFIYLKGVASTAVGSVVTFNADSFETALAVANAKGLIAVAMSANVANQYGWYQVYGKSICKVATLFASGNVAYLTSTAGTIDDAVVAGDEIYTSLSVSAIGTPSAGLAEVSISYPFVTDASN
jgi:hypothetical protein